jgi:alpha-glucoside transport system substrate-binding protein
MKPRRVENVLIAALVVTVLGSGCASSQPVEGEPLVVFANWRGEDADAFRSTLERFEQDTGIEVRYTGSASFATAIRERVEEGDPPDVALFPQPGVVRDLVEQGYIVPLPDDVRAAALTDVVPSVGDLAEAFGDLDSVIYRLNVKSLVWYRPEAFAENGYEIPSTWDELVDLSNTMIANGQTPWCLGVSAFAASGWPATDWIEDIVLRLGNTTIYDGWVEGTVPFTDGDIGAAFDAFSNLVLADRRVSGGPRGVLNTTPARAQDPMFADPPGCLMYRQASFQVTNLPEGLQIGPTGDVDVFVLPGPGADEPAPLLVGGSIAAAFTDRSETWLLMDFLASAEAGGSLQSGGGHVSPHAAVPPSSYGDAFDRRIAALLLTADEVRFDASDSMYSPVGTRSFLDAMTQFIATGRLESSLQTAQAGYNS